jgi:hypothetical protein
MKREILELTTTETADINGARHFFEDSEGFSQGDVLLDSATEYFGKKYFDLIYYKEKYRSERHQMLGYLSLEETQGIADRYQIMFERVVEARRQLEWGHVDDIHAWLSSSGTVRQAYKLVLADKLSRSPGYRESFFDGDEDGFSSDCHNVIQWLEGWLRSEAN